MNLQELIQLLLEGHTSFARKMVMKCYDELHKIVWKSLTMQVVVHHLPGLASFENLFSSVQSLNCVWLFVTPWTAAHQASLSITNSWSLLKLMCILGHPLLLLPSIFSSIRVFSRLISLWINWFDLLAVQGTLKTLLYWTMVQKHQFFGAQCSL